MVCREPAGTCDAEEACDGTSLACPADGPADDGTACDDGLACTAGGSCSAGACTATASVDCDDSDTCTSDTCVEPAGCAHEPIAACGPDAGAPDGGAAIDGSTPDAGTGIDGSMLDGGTAMDGSTDPSENGGCGCATPGSSSPTPSALVWAIVALVLVARPRRASAARGPSIPPRRRA